MFVQLPAPLGKGLSHLNHPAWLSVDTGVQVQATLRYLACMILLLLSFLLTSCLEKVLFETRKLQNRWVVVSRHHVSKIVIEARSQSICLSGT